MSPRFARLRPLLIWLAALAGCVLVIVHTRFVADLSAFMPRTPDARQQMLIEQLRDGIIARLVMVGIEGGDAASRAALSRGLAAQLRADPAFLGVQNGEAQIEALDRAWYFDNRYLLSPAVTPGHFSSQGLHEAIGRSIENLSGNAGILLRKVLPRDPTGESLALIEQFAGSSQPHEVEGVWASRDGSRALLLVQTRADGSDTDAQAALLDTIRSRFAALPGQSADSRLVMSGTAVFSVASRERIQGDIHRLAAISTLLVVLLLLSVYRSLRLLLTGLLPVLSGIVAGIATVSLVFGNIHGLTLAFGSTLIGEAVDYAIYFFIQRAAGIDARSFWRTMWLGVASSLAGFTVLLCSGFPGLAQLGVYSMAGLVAAALTGRHVLPALTPETLRLADLSGLATRLDRLIDAARRLRPALIALVIAAAAWVAWHGDALWNRKLNALSTVTQAEQALDASMRGDLGAPDMRYIAALTAPDSEQALQAAEAVGKVLQQEVRAGRLGSFTSPAAILPSLRTQQTRQAALPDEATLRARLAEALADQPLRPERLEGFIADVARARQQPALKRSDLTGSASALAVDSLLVQRAHDVLVLMPLRAPAGQEELDTRALEAGLAAAGLKNVAVLDILDESTRLFSGYLNEARLLVGGGMLVIFLLLVVALRSLPRALRAVAPLACAVVLVTAGLLASGTSLTILHLIGLLLVVAIGRNYTLFFDAGSHTGTARQREQVQVSIVVANLTAVGSFGALAFSKVPVLAYLGCTVGPGALLAFIAAAILSRKHDADTH
ncbi:MMPL family transporter [Uliginosibacterium paludis]|uniref:MMPL family transporter n=1 Tax=Uliginosibacterium paludis TaxID=1615952 RepID=A0ABV2CP55_9RHOO